jgi:hypothetical protein
MFKIIALSALLAAATAVPAHARGWLPTPVSPATPTPKNASAAPFVPSGKGLPLASTRDRAAQQSWWAMRSQRAAERRMAACVAMIECKGKHMATASDG